MPEVRALLRAVLDRGLVLDVEDRLRAESAKAHQMVVDHSGLDRKRARELEGQARFRMMEKGFEEVCWAHGGVLLEEGLIPGTKLKVFQPFMRFEASEQGVILGLAAMSNPETVPTKNKSRLAGVTLNYNLSLRLDFDGAGAKIGDIFALLLVSRDHDRAGLLDELALGVVTSNYTSFLFYESLGRFLRDTATPDPVPLRPEPDPGSGTAKVALRKIPKKFVPPEAPMESDEEADNN